MKPEALDQDTRESGAHVDGVVSSEASGHPRNWQTGQTGQTGQTSSGSHKAAGHAYPARQFDGCPCPFLGAICQLVTRAFVYTGYQVKDIQVVLFPLDRVAARCGGGSLAAGRREQNLVESGHVRTDAHRAIDASGEQTLVESVSFACE